MTQRHLLSSVLVLAASAHSQQLAPAIAAAENTITTDSLAGPLRFLSHDLLEGRGVGSRGDEMARLYIATQLESYGLRPAGPDGGWEQSVPILGLTAVIDRSLTVSKASGGDAKTFTAPEDYVVMAGRPNATTEWKDAEVVFVGYGIHAPEQNWDDYKGVDLAGKVVLVMNNDPSDDPELFAGKTRLYYGRWSYKYEEAARRGAVGAIVIHTTPSAGYPFQVIQAGHEREQFWLPFTDDQESLAIRSWCSEDAAKAMCELGGHDLDALRAAAETRDFRPVPLGVTADVSTANSVRELQSANVCGVLPGSDPRLKNEYVVLTSHFDHLGIGIPRRDDAIYNGALDNASGCAAMLNLARAVAGMRQRPRRSLLFLAVTAEESGLLGSLYYSRNPTVPVKQQVANVNIDGINIWGETRDIQMIGHGKNTLTALADEVARSRNRVLEPNKQVDLGLFYRSDHFSFARVGVPSAFFKAGTDFYDRPEDRNRVKNSYTAVRYHQPQDEFDARWNLHGAVADTRLILEVLVRCANDPTPPSWTPGDEFEALR